LRIHLDRLVMLEYLIVHRGARGQSFVYELVYDGQGQDGKPFVPGLIELNTLREAKSTTTIANLAGVNGQFAGPTRGQSGPNAGGSRPDENENNSIKTYSYDNSSLNTPKLHSTGGNGHDRSYPQAVIPSVTAVAAAAR
jgi:hypothetical protein